MPHQAMPTSSNYFVQCTSYIAEELQTRYPSVFTDLATGETAAEVKEATVLSASTSNTRRFGLIKQHSAST